MPSNFIKLIDRMSKAVGGKMKARIFTVQILYGGIIGKCSELVIRNCMKETSRLFLTHYKIFIIIVLNSN